MENFVVSARKYRPATFDTVVGQSTITTTLKNAIKTNHLAQAFLFCGPRGVGKTTCARILAKTINCFNRTEDIEACDNCDSCNSFNEGASLNIYELDAASNNSVDDIRNLVDQVRIAPQIGTHKVYIIDEVHMLSNAAFNAFLKTLEEPPAHAIFILATTEKHKIIPTILSRCQIFDFNRISVADIANHLKSIAEKENISADEESLHVVAEKADGALRDALSIFDQIVSFLGDHLEYQAVIRNLNILDYDYYFKATQILLEGKIHEVLLLFDEILTKGFGGQVFINGLAAHLRNLLVCKDESTISLLEVSDQVKSRYQEQSRECNLAFLFQSIEICRQCDREFKSSQNQRLLVELSLMQMASIIESDFPEKKKPKIKSAKQSPSENTPIKENTTTKNPIAKLESKVQSDSTETKNSSINKVPASPLKTLENNTPKPKVVQNISGLKTKTSSLSISELTKTSAVAEGKNDAEEFTSELRESFDNKTFEDTWAKMITYLENQELSGWSIIGSALRGRKPIVDKDFKITLKVENKTQEEEVSLIRTEIHSFLRKALKNGALELELKIVRNKKEKKAYTNEEKFNKLAEKHPILLKLKKELDLDFF